MWGYYDGNNDGFLNKHEARIFYENFVEKDSRFKGKVPKFDEFYDQIVGTQAGQVTKIEMASFINKLGDPTANFKKI